MMNLKDKKGIILITTYMIMCILLTLSAALFIRNIVEIKALQRNHQLLQALYLAEQGVSYAYIEAQSHPTFQWHTHEIDVATNILKPVESTDRPVVTLTEECQINNVTGVYELINPIEGQNFQVKTYAELYPSGHPNENKPTGATIVLSRGIVGQSERIVKYKIGFGGSSLFEHFIVSLDDLLLTSLNGGVDEEGNPLGKIYSNKSIRFTNGAILKNIKEISAKTIGYNINPYRIPSYLLDGLDGIMNNADSPIAPSPAVLATYGATSMQELNSQEQEEIQKKKWAKKDWQAVIDEMVARGMFNNAEQAKAAYPYVEYPWQKLNWNWNNQDGYTWHPDWDIIKIEWENLSLDPNGFFSESKASYHHLMPPYTYIPAFSGPNGFSDYKNATTDSFFEDGAFIINNINGIPTEMAIPNKLPGYEYAYDRFYPDPYSDQIDYDANYLNTKLQPDWNNSSEMSMLREILKENSDNEKSFKPLKLSKIRSHFKRLAKNNGIFIIPPERFESEEELKDIYPEEWRLVNADIITKKEFFNTVRPTLNSLGNPIKDTVYQININKLKTFLKNNLVRFNGVIFSEYPLRIVAGKKLPKNGLTIYSDGPIYIKGDYNYMSGKKRNINDKNWEPAAIITPNVVYCLSNAFANGPNKLPELVHNLDYPWEPDLPNEEKYFKQHVNDMPNLVAKSSTKKSPDRFDDKGNNIQCVTYRTAIVSTHNPLEVHSLERWRTGYSGTGKIRYQVLIGAFVQIEQDGEILADGNIRLPDGEDYVTIPKIQDIYKCRDKKCRAWPDDPYFIFKPAQIWEFDPLLTGESRPPGASYVGVPSIWQEVTDFEHP
jgi:type II secretory pathway pseudopilin PulG